MKRPKGWQGSRESYLWTKFRLPPGGEQEILAAQDNCCACCGKSLEGLLPAQKAVDHNHITGKLRAIVCAGCNTKIGWYERPDWYWAQVKNYLDRYDLA